MNGLTNRQRRISAIAASFVLVALLAGMAGYGIASANVVTTTAPAVLGQYGLDKTCTFLTFTDSASNVYGQNCQTGQIVYGGPNNVGSDTGLNGGAAVIQSEINACTVQATPGGGCEIVINDGKYAMSAGLTIPNAAHNVHILGQGMNSTQLDWENAPAGVHSAFSTLGTADGLVISNLWIKGNLGSANMTGISFKTDGITFFTLSQDFIHSFPTNEILLRNHGTAGIAYGEFQHLFLSCTGSAQAGAGVGINFDELSGDFINGNQFDNVQISGCHDGVLFQGAGANEANNRFFGLSCELGTYCLSISSAGSANNYFVINCDGGASLTKCENITGGSTSNPSTVCENSNDYTVGVIDSTAGTVNRVCYTQTGLIANPLADAPNHIIGFGTGTYSADILNAAFTINRPILMVQTAAGGSESITIKDPAGNTVYSGNANLPFTGEIASSSYFCFPVGWTYNPGAITTNPTVLIYAVASC